MKIPRAHFANSADKSLLDCEEVVILPSLIACPDASDNSDQDHIPLPMLPAGGSSP
jgi:hypothetical protein